MGQVFKSAFDALCDTPVEAANMRLRADLMMRIARIVEENGWNQAQAAAKCGITQPRISDLLNGRIDRFSLDALVNIHAQIGQEEELHFSYA